MPPRFWNFDFCYNCFCPQLPPKICTKAPNINWVPLSVISPLVKYTKIFKKAPQQKQTGTYMYTMCMVPRVPPGLTRGQGCSQSHSPGQEFHFPHFSSNFHHFSYFSSNFPHSCPHFGPTGAWVAHPGRPWLRHCRRIHYPMIISSHLLTA